MLLKKTLYLRFFPRESCDITKMLRCYPGAEFTVCYAMRGTKQQYVVEGSFLTQCGMNMGKKSHRENFSFDLCHYSFHKKSITTLTYSNVKFNDETLVFEGRNSLQVIHDIVTLCGGECEL